MLQSGLVHGHLAYSSERGGSRTPLRCHLRYDTRGHLPGIYGSSLDYQCVLCDSEVGISLIRAEAAGAAVEEPEIRGPWNRGWSQTSQTSQASQASQRDLEDGVMQLPSQAWGLEGQQTINSKPTTGVCWRVAAQRVSMTVGCAYRAG